MPNLPLLLLILDGWGIDKPNAGNAVLLAKTPVMDSLVREYPHTTLHAHGKYAGLPNRQVGNSEAGHFNIGAGRLVEQDVVIVNKAIKDGTFYKNPAFVGAVRHVRKLRSRIHLVGMLSNGQSPHSDPLHLYALLNMLKKDKIEEVYLHLFTDGRDSPPYVSLKLIDDLEKKLFPGTIIATVIGRFYAMDRKKEWERTERTYDALVLGQGRKAPSPQAAITESYNRGLSDEFVEPYVIANGHEAESRIKEGDSVIFFNLRSDRGRQLAKAFVQKDFTAMNPGSFVRKKKLDHLYFTAMTDFGPDLDDIITAYPSIDLHNTFPMQIPDLTQLYLAETEKYAHVTYFFNGGYSGKVGDEDHLMVPSPNVKSYDETPAMSSEKLAEIVVDNLRKGKGGGWKYDVTICNFAAPDMIGHTGNLNAAIECCCQVDRLLGKIIKAYLAAGGTVLVTSDHGNIEKMINMDTGEIYTQHTANPVPFVLVSNKVSKKLRMRAGGVLGDIAPTMLKLLGRKKPKEMSGKSLF